MTTAQKTIRFYWRHARRYPKYLIGLFIAVPITIFLQFLPSLIAAKAMDRLTAGDFDANNIWNSFSTEILLYTLVALIGGIVAWRVVVVLIWKLEALVARNINREAFDHLMLMSASFHANRFGGSLVSQVGKLSGSYIRFADTTVFTTVPLILTFAYTAIILTPLTPLYVLALLAFSIIFIAATVFVAKRVRKLNTAEADAQNKQTGYLADAITNVMAVKSFAAGDIERKRFHKATEHSRQATMALMRRVVRQDMFFGSITSAITIISFIAAIIGVAIFKAEISLVFLVVNYTGLVIRSLWEFCHSAMRNYNRSFGDAEAMMEIFEVTPDVQDAANPQKLRVTKGAITLQDLDFRHIDAGDDTLLFDKLNFNIAAGEKVGLVGHSGSGKTTLTKLLLRFADATGGQIAIDDQSIADISQDDLRRAIAYVPQEPMLFHRSIFDNIAYGQPKASKAQVERAAKLAHAAEFIDKLPQKYETLVGERGVKLSGGQRQRIAIARAMLKNAPILVLDEATSALDSESERLIQSALWELMKGRTAIVIAHRLSTIQRMDRIIVLEDGKIIEQGTHKELLANKGVYAGLWEHQSGGFIEE